MIHITDANESLVELKNPNTWENLKKAARVRNFTTGNLDLMNDDDSIVPDVKYHRKCYQAFTMKSKLEKIEKPKQVTADLVPHAEFSTFRPKRYSNPENRLLPKECIFCRKNKYENKVLEKLVKCVDDRDLATKIAVASTTEDHYVRGLVDQYLIARDAHHHSKCYKLFIMNNKSPPITATITTPYKEAELVAFKEVLQKCYKLCKNPDIVAFHDYVVSPMKSPMESNGFAMKDSSRKSIRNKLEKECKEINFINYNNSVYIYPSSLKIEDVVLKSIKQADEAVKLKDKLATEIDPLSACGKLI